MANYWDVKQGRFPVMRAVGTSPVGTYPPNGYGLHDMTGNAWQWVADWYGFDHFKEQAKRGAITNERACAELRPGRPHRAGARTEAGHPRRLLSLQCRLLPELPPERAPRQRPVQPDVARRLPAGDEQQPRTIEREKSMKRVSVAILSMAFAVGAQAQTKAAALDRTVLPIRSRRASRSPSSMRARPRRRRASRSSRRRAERRDRADRRHRLRPQQRLRRADPHAHAGEAGGRRPQVQPLPHHRALQPHAHALLTGHNHHANNAGAIMELATAFPGNTGVRPRTITTLAEILRQNGYSTAAFGKYHETRPGKSRSPVPTTAGRARASTSSTASSAARPTSGRRRSTTARCASSTSRAPTTTSPWT